MTTSQEVHQDRHPTFRQYVVVATLLFVITIVEFLLIWQRVGIADDLGASKVPLLIALSAVKFAVVIMFYMHLKFESWLFSGVFLAGLALAFAVGIGLLGLFVALNGEPREFAETNRVAFAHEEAEAQVSEPAEAAAGTTDGTDQPAQTGTQETAPADAVAPQADAAVTEEAPAVPVAAAGALDIAADGDALQFNTGMLSAQAGSEVVLTFNNVSTINQHNWVLVNAGDKDAVAADGTAAGPANDWIKPDDPRVIAHTGLLDPGTTGEVRFTAPAAGAYEFVCTFPGHNFTMFGDFQVSP